MTDNGRAELARMFDPTAFEDWPLGNDNPKRDAAQTEAYRQADFLLNSDWFAARLAEARAEGRRDALAAYVGDENDAGLHLGCYSQAELEQARSEGERAGAALGLGVLRAVVPLLRELRDAEERLVTLTRGES